MPEDIAGGKGINVSKAVHLAGARTLALYPASDQGKFTRLLEVSGIPHEAINTLNEARVNLTLAEADGTTTKLNSPGFTLTKEHRRRVLEKLHHHAKDATWAVFAGSLPPGVPRDFYVSCIQAVKAGKPSIKVALDTSDGPLDEVVKHLGDIHPSLMKPNSFELGHVTGTNGKELEEAASAGNFEPAIAAAKTLVALGVHDVLATLGSAGAVLVTSSGEAFVETAPKIDVQSTVGAGDCALAGYVLGRERGLEKPAALQLAMAYGAAATSLPGTQIPAPELVESIRTQL